MAGKIVFPLTPPRRRGNNQTLWLSKSYKIMYVYCAVKNNNNDDWAICWLCCFEVLWRARNVLTLTGGGRKYRLFICSINGPCPPNDLWIFFLASIEKFNSARTYLDLPAGCYPIWRETFFKLFFLQLYTLDMKDTHMHIASVKRAQSTIDPSTFPDLILV